MTLPSLGMNWQCFQTSVSFALINAFDLFNFLPQNLADSLAVRRDQWLKFLAFKSVQCKNEFMKTFSTRGYFGQMIFDHEAGTLELKAGMVLVALQCPSLNSSST